MRQNLEGIHHEINLSEHVRSILDFLQVLVHIDFKIFINLKYSKKNRLKYFNLSMHSSYESPYGSSLYAKININ